MNFLKTKLDNMRAKMGNEKGLTMMELMFVLLIIAIIIAVIVGVGGRGTDKARETGVNSDFKNFLDQSEMYLATGAGVDLTQDELITELNAGGLEAKKDPWENLYVPLLPQDDKGDVIATVTSNGKDGVAGVAGTDDDYLGAVYYKEGKTARCTLGLGSNEINTVNQVFAGDFQLDGADGCGKPLVVAP